MSDGQFMPKATAVWLVQNTTLSFKQIASFCNLHEIYQYSLGAINHQLKRLCTELMYHYKINNAIYKNILAGKRSNIEIQKLKLVFFKLKNFRDNFKDFRSFIFFIFDKLNSDEFGLITRMDKFCYIKRIDDNRALLFLYHEKTNIYYSLFYKTSLTGNNLPDNLNYNSGYLYYNNNLIQENADIIKYI